MLEVYHHGDTYMVYNCSYCYLDNYVHRLVHNKTDGKLVEVPGTSDDVSLCVVLHVIGIHMYR